MVLCVVMSQPRRHPLIFVASISTTEAAAVAVDNNTIVITRLQSASELRAW